MPDVWEQSLREVLFALVCFKVVLDFNMACPIKFHIACSWEPLHKLVPLFLRFCDGAHPRCHILSLVLYTVFSKFLGVRTRCNITSFGLPPSVILFLTKGRVVVYLPCNLYLEVWKFVFFYKKLCKKILVLFIRLIKL